MRKIWEKKIVFLYSPYFFSTNYSLNIFRQIFFFIKCFFTPIFFLLSFQLHFFFPDKIWFSLNEVLTIFFNKSFVFLSNFVVFTPNLFSSKLFFVKNFFGGDKLFWRKIKTLICYPYIVLLRPSDAKLQVIQSSTSCAYSHNNMPSLVLAH